MHGSTERMSAQKLNDIWTGRVIQIPTTIANPSHTEERKNEHVNLGLFAVRNLAVLHCEKTQIHSAIIMTNGNLMRDKSWVNDAWCSAVSHPTCHREGKKSVTKRGQNLPIEIRHISLDHLQLAMCKAEQKRHRASLHLAWTHFTINCAQRPCTLVKPNWRWNCNVCVSVDMHFLMLQSSLASQCAAQDKTMMSHFLTTSWLRRHLTQFMQIRTSWRPICWPQNSLGASLCTPCAWSLPRCTRLLASH